jgi:secernin
MCDLMVAMPDATKSGNVIFGKNSDRPARECQVLHYSPGSKKEIQQQIDCSYITLSDAEETLSVFGCRPYWCWGYETGMNEAGVVGGNAATYTRSFWLPENREKPGLTGMDLLRLGLERGNTAEKAVDIITQFLEEYGQWGSAVRGKDHENGSYENSFLIADSNEAWVLETTGKRWIAGKITHGIRSISNEPTIRNNGTKSSKDIEQFALDNGWWNKSNDDFDFAYVYGDHEHYSRQVSHIRLQRSSQLLRQNIGEINIQTIMSILRDHYEDTFLNGPQFHPFQPDFLTLCMHDSPAKFTWGNTATSVVVELDKDQDAPTPFWLSYLPPCSNVYMPLFLNGQIPEMITNTGKVKMNVCRPEEAPKDEFDSNSLWWRLNRILEEIAKDPHKRQNEVRKKFDTLENEFISTVQAKDREMSFAERSEMMQIEVSKVLQGIESLEKSWNIV